MPLGPELSLAIGNKINLIMNSGMDATEGAKILRETFPSDLELEYIIAAGLRAIDKFFRIVMITEEKSTTPA